LTLGADAPQDTAFSIERGRMHLPPFHLTEPWLKGNLHTHSSLSDGERSPDDVLAWHRAHGYDFVAITDHDTRTVGITPEGLSVLPGAELSLGFSAAGAPLHVVAIGLPEYDRPLRYRGPATLDALRELGALAFISHPCWSMLSPSEVLGLRGCLGMEVYNTGADYECSKGYATVHWDQALNAGWRAFGFATDDSHWKLPDHGGGWIMLRSPQRSSEHILRAIAAGHFYASCGPRIEDLQLDDLRLSVRCSPVESIHWVAHAHLGWSRHAAPGETITEAEFTIDPRARYVRVQVMDPTGRWAWSQAHLLRLEK
jgi:hypothetical protein